MKLKLELGCMNSVHKLVQFWCVIVGKPLGRQLSHYLENLEWEIVMKLSYLFVKDFRASGERYWIAARFPVVY